ncbi:MAG: hypothetical protein IPK80_28275 [Nannocystis sp.]|nr:hypothetical protein [Nannocystis sp.]
MNAGLIEGVNGDDERLKKMERASITVAKGLQAEPLQLIGTILAALDPDVSASDPAIARADSALAAEWSALRSIHPSTPINLLRAILLDACSQMESDHQAAILWFTAADTLPLMRLGREETIIRDVLMTLAKRTETLALDPFTSAQRNKPANQVPKVVRRDPKMSPAATKSRTVNRDALLLRIAASAGPTYKSDPQKPLAGTPNPHWTTQGGTWSWEFSDRMNTLLSDELDSLAKDLSAQCSQNQQDLHAGLVQMLDEKLASQQLWVREALNANEARSQSEEVRLNVLWWSEAMYSRSLCCGYRELPAQVASVVMALDLVDDVTKPAPASIGYLLAEAVHRLPGAGFGHEYALLELLGALGEARGRIPKTWSERLATVPDEGRLSLRDLAFSALAGQKALVLDRNLKRAGLGAELKLSLPSFAKALFRQEQAVQLAGVHR